MRLLAVVLALAAQGCKNPPEQPGPGSSTDAGSAAPAPSDGRSQEETCVDRWLSARGLDRYGHPEGTMYAGGTPLFDERTGETKDRLAYVYERHPEAKQQCGKPE